MAQRAREERAAGRGQDRRAYVREKVNAVQGSPPLVTGKVVSRSAEHLVEHLRDPRDVHAEEDESEAHHKDEVHPQRPTAVRTRDRPGRDLDSAVRAGREALRIRAIPRGRNHDRVPFGLKGPCPFRRAWARRRAPQGSARPSSIHRTRDDVD